jgi:heat shock protein HslJ
MATTKKMCAGKASEIERGFLTTLQKANKFELNSGLLILFEEEKKLAKFKMAH